MMARLFACLAAAAVSALAAGGPAHTYGIPKSLVGLYNSPDGKFKCLDGNGVIATSQVRAGVVMHPARTASDSLLRLHLCLVVTAAAPLCCIAGAPCACV